MRLVLTTIEKVESDGPINKVTFADGIVIYTNRIGPNHVGSLVVRYDNTAKVAVGVDLVSVEDHKIKFLEHLCGDVGVGLVVQFKKGDSVPLGLSILLGLAIQ